jgi:tape measure domain-containing protein
VSVVANVAINLDARGVTERLKAIRQTSIGAADGFTKLSARAQAVKSIVEAQQGSFAKASTVQGVFAAKVKNTEFAIKAQIAALRDVQSKVQLNGALYQKAAAQIAQYEATLAKTTATQDRSQKSLGGLRGALAGIGAGFAVRKAFVDASELESAQARIGLLTKNFSQLTGIQEVAANAAKKFNLSQAESLGTLTDLGNRIGPTGASLQDVANVYEGFNTLLALNKVNTQNAASATLQLNQALGSGRLAGEEFNAISEATPQLLDAVAAVMGRNRSELKQLASDGKISSQVLIEALTRIRTEGAEDLETAFAGAFGATRRFNAALEDFSATIGTELLPALTPLISGATEILKLFGRLPGPVRTLIAAVAGLTAAFVVLAPAISTAIGLLGGLSLATLAAAGPWIALAAGIGVAVAALASYRSEAEKVGGAARGGGASNVAAASKLLAQKDAQIAGLQGQRQTASGRQRGSIDRNLAVLRRERAQLQSDVKAGTAATPAATAGNAMGTPVGATVGGATSGGRKAGGGADKAASDAKRALEIQKQQYQVADDRNTALKDTFALLQQTEAVAKRELELDIRLGQIAREFNTLKEEAKSADELAMISLNENLEKKIAELEAEREINELLIQRATLVANLVKASSMPTVYNELETQDAALQAILDKYPAIGSAADAAATLATSGMAAMIDGTKSAQEVFADFLNTIANALMQTAAKMIAQYIAIGIARMFAGMGGSVPTDAGGWATSFATPQPGIGTGFNFDAGAMTGGMPWSFGGGRAAGGPVSSGQTYMVGERGPELFVPGRSGTIVANDKMGGGNTNVVVNVDAKGSSVEGDEQGANQLGRVISAAVQSELIKQQRPGGILAR